MIPGFSHVGEICKKFLDSYFEYFTRTVTVPLSNFMEESHPWASAMRRTSERPIPDPFPGVPTNASKAFLMTFGSASGAGFENSKPVEVKSTVILESEGACTRAFDARFLKRVQRIFASAGTVAGASEATATAKRSAAQVRASVSSNTERRSVGSVLASAPEAEKSRRSSTVSLIIPISEMADLR